MQELFVIYLVSHIAQIFAYFISIFLIGINSCDIGSTRGLVGLPLCCFNSSMPGITVLLCMARTTHERIGDKLIGFCSKTQRCYFVTTS